MRGLRRLGSGGYRNLVYFAACNVLRNLRRIFASVQRDYPRARRLGHALFTA